MERWVEEQVFVVVVELAIMLQTRFQLSSLLMVDFLSAVRFLFSLIYNHRFRWYTISIIPAYVQLKKPLCILHYA